MQEIFTSGWSLPDAYHEALVQLYRYGDITPCPDWNTEQKECAMTFLVNEPLREPMISRCIIGGPEDLEQYRQEMLDGILDFEVGKGNWSYTYHRRMVDYDKYGSSLGLDAIDQIQFVVEELRRNPYSRRAVIDVRNNFDDMGADDPACLQHLQLFIRDGKLHLKALFRSNDAIEAAFFNAFALVMLQKRIADELGVEVGTYTHRANSFHVYKKNYGMLESVVKRYEAAKPMKYYYEGDWKELMEEAKPRIAEKVRRLREEHEKKE